MYAVIFQKQIIAIHDELQVVEEFVQNQPSSDEFSIVKLKGKKSKNEKYQDLYLVICNGEYVPYNLYSTLKKERDCDNHDLIMCKETLFKLLSETSLDKKERKSIRKTLIILDDIIAKPSGISYSTIKDIHDMNIEYNNIIEKED